MEKTTSNALDELVGRAIEDYLQRVDRGERPELEAFIQRYPTIGEMLRTVIPAMEPLGEGLDASSPAVRGRHSHKQLGDFRILRQIGRGGMGVVYEAEQISMQRRVALKVLPLAGLLDDVRIQRFQNEVRAAAALDHSHIVSIYMVGEERGVHYYAMQLIRGRSLSQVIASLRRVSDTGLALDGTSISQVAKGSVDDAPAEDATANDATEAAPLAPARSGDTVVNLDDSTIPHASRREYFCSVATLGIQAASALQHAHDRGIIHRDVKPANLLLDRSCQLYLADFGLARIEANAGMTMTGDLIGTLRYMAPEQALAKRVTIDHRADIYSLGATLYELLALRPAYLANDHRQLLKQIAFEDPTPLRRVDRAIPVELATIVQKAMAKDMAHRYASADEMTDDLTAFLQNRPIKARPPTTLEVISKWSRRNPVLTAATAVVVMTVAVCSFLVARERGRFSVRNETAKATEATLANERWARSQAIPRIREFVVEERFDDALRLALRVAELLPDDPELAALWPEFSVDAQITSEPTGIEVSIRPWNATNDDWESIGQTPIDGTRLANGHYHWRLSKVGYGDLVSLRNAWKRMHFKLETASETYPDMVLVPGGDHFVSLGGLSVERRVVGDFLIDRYEVTNGQFQEFVNAGGYDSPKYWKPRFVRDGTPVSWEQAMAEFVDTTGEHGPAGWISGHYPEGEENHPVRGVSWYEAAAFAEFAGKRLPSVYHWSRAADLWGAHRIIPISNFGGESPAAVGVYQGVVRCGAFDMAGNVKEWCWNAAGDDKRFIVGGAWNEPQYMFNYPDWRPGLERANNFGFRCVRPLSAGEASPGIDDQIIVQTERFIKEPASPEQFALYKRAFAYDKSDVEATSHFVREEDGYTYEKVEFDTPYGERMAAHFYRPTEAAPPYQTVIYFPPAHVQYQDFNETVLSGQIAFLVRHGRAVLYPVYKGSYERKDPDLGPSSPAKTTPYRQYVIWWFQDFARSLDYLESRADVDHQRLGYYGYSWGASLAPILLALDDRIKVAVLSGAGRYEQPTYPEVSQLTYAKRVTIPVLMLNGRFNSFFPIERSVRPLYKALGTAEEEKNMIPYDCTQVLPQKKVDKAANAWFDDYLGPVRQ